MRRARRRRRDQRLVDQPREEELDVAGGHQLVRAHRAGGVEREAAGEDAEARQQPALDLEQQIEAPLHRGVQGLLPRRPRRVVRRDEAEAVAEQLGQLAGGERPRARRRQLDGQRQAVDVVADRGDGRPSASASSTNVPDESAARVANRATASSGASGGSRHTTSPGMPSGSRLVARTRTPGHERSSAATAPVAASPTRCSQLSTTTSSSVSANPVVSQSSPASASVWPRRGRTCAGTPGRRRRRRSPPRAPRASSRRATAAPPAAPISTAMRVLPTPPGPVTVTRRRSASTASIRRELVVAAEERRQLGVDVRQPPRRPARRPAARWRRPDRGSAPSRARSAGPGSRPSSSARISACPLEGPQRVRLPAGPVERQHEQLPEALAHRVLRHEALQLRHDGVVAPGRQLGVDADLGRRQAELVETGPLCFGEVVEREVGQRGTAPQAATRRAASTPPARRDHRPAARRRRAAASSKRRASMVPGSTAST